MSEHEFAVTLKLLGSRWKLMRKARGLSRDEVAQRSGLAVDTIARAENGTFAASLTTMIKIAAGLGVPLPALLTDSYDHADDLTSMIRALPPREYASAVAVVKALHRLAEEEAVQAGKGTRK